MYLGEIKVSSSPVYTYDTKYCTAKFYGDEIISLGFEYEADIFG